MVDFKKNTRKFFLTFLVLLVSNVAHAIFFPGNVMYRSTKYGEVGAVQESDFHQLIEKTYVAYAPLAELHGGTLVFERLWNDDRIFTAPKRKRDEWIVQIRGGAARIPDLSVDGFQYILCHEVGQHFAGFPFYQKEEWVATEGQNAYFASQACLRLLWKGEKAENLSARNSTDPYTKERCDEVWVRSEDQNLCYRIANSAHSAMSSYAFIRGFYPPGFERPDPYIVARIYGHAPKAQARLDIAFAGALCTVNFDPQVIPGLTQSRDDHNGIEAERDAAKYSCHRGNGMIDGVRPLSWFRPGFEYQALKFKDSFVLEVQGNKNGILEPGEVGELKLGVKNESEIVTKDIQVTMSSRSRSIAIDRAFSSYPDLAPGSEMQYNRNKLYFKVANNATCGAAFDLRAVAKNNQGSAHFKEKFYLGAFTSFEVGKIEEFIDINPYTLTFSKMENKQSGAVTKAEVEIDIHHQTIRAVKFFLIAPDGSEKFLANHISESDDNAVFTRVIDIPVEEAQGDWTLKIVDDQPFSKGYLRSWKLKLHQASCEN